MNLLAWEMNEAERAAVALSERELPGLLAADVALAAPCAGRRQRSSEDFVCVVHVAEGCARGYGDRGERLFSAGDLMAWHSGLRIGFQVIEAVRQTMLLVPRSRAPALWEGLQHTGDLHVGAAHPLRPCMAAYFGELATRLGSMPGAAAASAAQGGLDLVTRAFGCSVAGPPARGSALLLQRLQRYADTQLHDPALSPGRVAAAHGISKRHLHALFARQGPTFSAWVREQRLAHCRDELVGPLTPGAITSAAMRWGFNDPAHFSRLFRQRFGVSPREWAVQGSPAPAGAERDTTCAVPVRTGRRERRG